jgi:hypothetical protein
MKTLQIAITLLLLTANIVTHEAVGQQRLSDVDSEGEVMQNSTWLVGEDDRDYLVTYDLYDQVRLYHLEGDDLWEVADFHIPEIYAGLTTSIDQQGQYFVVTDMPDVYILNCQSGTLRHFVLEDVRSLQDYRWIGFDGTVGALSDESHTNYLVDLSTVELQSMDSQEIRAFADGILVLYDRDTGITSFVEHPSGVVIWQVHRDFWVQEVVNGRFVVSLTEVYDLQSRLSEPIPTEFLGPEAQQDGRYLVSSQLNNGSVTLYDVVTQRRVRSLPGYPIDYFSKWLVLDDQLWAYQSGDDMVLISLASGLTRVIENYDLLLRDWSWLPRQSTDSTDGCFVIDADDRLALVQPMTLDLVDVPLEGRNWLYSQLLLDGNNVLVGDQSRTDQLYSQSAVAIDLAAGRARALNYTTLPRGLANNYSLSAQGMRAYLNSSSDALAFDCRSDNGVTLGQEGSVFSAVKDAIVEIIPLTDRIVMTVYREALTPSVDTIDLSILPIRVETAQYFALANGLAIWTGMTMYIGTLSDGTFQLTLSRVATSTPTVENGFIFWQEDGLAYVSDGSGFYTGESSSRDKLISAGESVYFINSKRLLDITDLSDIKTIQQDIPRAFVDDRILLDRYFLLSVNSRKYLVGPGGYFLDFQAEGLQPVGRTRGADVLVVGETSSDATHLLDITTGQLHDFPTELAGYDEFRIAQLGEKYLMIASDWRDGYTEVVSYLWEHDWSAAEALDRDQVNGKWPLSVVSLHVGYHDALIYTSRTIWHVDRDGHMRPLDGVRGSDRIDGRTVAFDFDNYYFQAISPDHGLQVWRLRADIPAEQSTERSLVTLYPNPAEQWARLDHIFDGSATATVTDVMGRQVREVVIDGTCPQIELYGLQSGLYHVRYSVDGKPYTGTVVVGR